MGCKVAQAGFLVFLLSSSVVQAHTDYRVTYSSNQICALQGSTVDIDCTHTYPLRGNENVTVTEEAVWFTKMNRGEPVDLMTDAEFTGRVQYLCGKNKCTLRITDLRYSDSAEYKFMFMTNQLGGEIIGSPGVRLSVTALQVQVTGTSIWSSWTNLTCSSSCRLPDHYSYIWYMNGKNFYRQKPSFDEYFDDSDSIACAVRGYEKFPSPSMCVHDSACSRVIYTNRNLCALKGSSVDISCTYIHKYLVLTKFWFRPGHTLWWQDYSQPEDLSQHSQYAGRVEVFESKGLSTLRIRDLRDTDSAAYHFKFKTRKFEWKSSLPGTTLTVTALQVQVTRIISVHQSHTEAELKCQSSCSPAGGLFYVWFKNGQKNTTQQSSTYTDSFYPGDNISCAFKGHEDHRSPSVYPSKLPSVSVNPSGEIVEGSSVTLTCRTYANPAAKNTLYKGNQTQPLGSAGIYHFTSISSEDRGTYYCKSEDQHSVSFFIDILYAPKFLSVSVSPSAEIVEGSSVNLTCSSDANPAADYTWYKENEDSPKASGQMLTITDFRAEHSGNYSCEAQNTRGRHRFTVHLTTVSSSWKFTVALSITAVFLASILLFLLLWIRRDRSLKQQSQAGGAPDSRAEMDEIQYASVQFSTNQTDAVYSNFSPRRLHRHQEESVVYATTNLNSTAGTRRLTGVEDASALYSKVA